MAIDGIKGISGSQPTDLGGKATGNARQANESERSGDRVELSEQARQIAGLKQAAQQLPDVRAERVQELQRALSDGTYRVDARQLAEKILEFEGDLDR